ncbi:MAG: allantoicase [Candidatus Azotimanducaceae bacterium]|jgi:allantoicase
MSQFLAAFLINYTDSSFTNPHEVVLPDEPQECTGNFTHMGAKYWGFESERHCAISTRAGNRGFHFDHDAFNSLVIGLTQRSLVREIRISTKWFTGNQVPCVAVDLIDGDNEVVVLERVTLEPDQEHIFTISETWATRCRVRCFHEGGIARVNLFGDPGAALYNKPNLLEFAEVSHISNVHYGSPQMAVRGQRIENHMVGWESARSGFGEQAIFQLRRPTQVQSLIVDTYLHRLNPPLSCHLFGLPAEEEMTLDDAISKQPHWQITFDDGTTVTPPDIQAYMRDQAFLNEAVLNPRQFNIDLALVDDSPWVPLIRFAPLLADAWHELNKIESNQPVQHLLYMHFPNGGVHGLKLFGQEL